MTQKRKAPRACGADEAIVDERHDHETNNQSKQVQDLYGLAFLAHQKAVRANTDAPSAINALTARLTGQFMAYVGRHGACS